MTESVSAKSIARNAVYSLAGTAAAFITGISVSIIVARSLGPQEFGIFSLLQWFRVTMALILDFGLANVVTKYWAELNGRKQKELANRLVLLLFATQTGLAFLFGLIIFSSSSQVAGLLGNQEIVAYLPITIIALVLAIVNSFLRATLAGMQRFKAKGMADIVTSVANIVGIIIVLKNGWGIWGLLWLEVAVATIQVLIFVPVVFRHIEKWPGHLAIPKQTLRNIGRYCAGVFLFTTFNAIIAQRSETFFLSRYHSSEQIAYFGLAFNIATTVMTFIPNTLAVVIMPALSNRFGANDHKSMQAIYAMTVKYILLITLPICSSGIALAAPFIRLMYGTEYQTVATVLGILLPGAVIGSLTTPLLALFWALGKSHMATLWMIPTSLISLSLAFIFVPSFGAVGAAVSNSISQTVSIVIGVVYLSRYQNFRLPFNQIFRILTATIPVGIIIYFLTGQLPDMASIAVGTPAGVLVYLLGLMLTRAFTAQDFDVLEEAGEMLPRPVVPVHHFIIVKARAYLT